MSSEREGRVTISDIARRLEISKASVSSLLLRLTGEHGEVLQVYRRWARQRRVDGFILDDEHDDDPRIPFLEGMGIPGVMVTSRDLDDRIGRLIAPELETVSVILDHLDSLGHKRIAHVSRPVSFTHERVRADMMTREGKRRCMRMRHVEGGYDYDSGAERTQELLSPPRRSRPK